MGRPGGHEPERFGTVQKGLLICGALWAFPTSGAAQDGGFVLGASVSQQLSIEDSEVSAQTDLGLILSTQTRTQRLLFDIGAGLELAPSGLGGSGLENSRLRFEYGLETRNTALDFDVNYRRSDLDTSILSDSADEPILVIDAGQREDQNTGLTLTLGREARFGTTASLAYSETNFFDTSSSDVIDSTSLSGAVRLRFDLTRNTSAFVGLTASDLDRDGGTDIRNTNLTASLETQVTEALQATLDLGVSRVERDNALTGEDTTQEGLTYGISVVAERPNGSLSGLLESDLLENGRRTTLQVNRQLTLPRGAISAGAGVSRNSDNGGGLDPLYNLAYTLALPRSEINVSLDQRFSTSTTGIETLNSRLNLSLSQTLSTKANLSAIVGFRDSDPRSLGATASNQFDISLSYAYELTPTWDMFGGISHTRRHIEGQSDTTEDRLFIGLRANFEWRP